VVGPKIPGRPQFLFRLEAFLVDFFSLFVHANYFFERPDVLLIAPFEDLKVQFSNNCSADMTKRRFTDD
jgi:hypothetical protein